MNHFFKYLQQSFMKAFLAFSILLVSPYAFGKVAGTWANSGAGCRDSNLSHESHVSKSLSQVGFEYIDSAILNIQDDGDVTLIVRQKNGDDKEYRGSYTFENSTDTLTIDPSDTHPDIELSLISGYLVATDLGGDDAAICGAGKKAVLVFGKTN